MNNCRILCLFSIIIICITVSNTSFAKDSLRFALIVGANDGGIERVALRYAIKDANNMRDVLTELGNFNNKNIILLDNPSKAQIINSIRILEGKITDASNKNIDTQFLFYYSGHSDETSLRMGEERFGYKQLKQMINGITADVNVIILDSCASGAMLLTKGGKHVAPFPIDESTKLEGHIILTSSSADEDSQESDTLEASFFTHYLVSGLRGAADYSNDSIVTLQEAYQFAFDETLRKSEDTLYGAQHPNYDIQLSGKGKFVWTDLRNASSTLILSKDIAGRFFIRNSKGTLVSEASKKQGDKFQIAIEPGKYQFTLKTDSDMLYRFNFTLKRGENKVILKNAIVPIPKVQTRARGDVQVKTPAPTITPVSNDLLAKPQLPQIITGFENIDGKQKYFRTKKNVGWTFIVLGLGTISTGIYWAGLTGKSLKNSNGLYDVYQTANYADIDVAWINYFSNLEMAQRYNLASIIVGGVGLSYLSAGLIYLRDNRSERIFPKSYLKPLGVGLMVQGILTSSLGVLFQLLPNSFTGLNSEAVQQLKSEFIVTGSSSYNYISNIKDESLRKEGLYRNLGYSMYGVGASMFMIGLILSLKKIDKKNPQQISFSGSIYPNIESKITIRF